MLLIWLAEEIGAARRTRPLRGFPGFRAVFPRKVPQRRNIDGWHGFWRGGSVAGETRWRNAPARPWRGRCGDVAFYPQRAVPCLAWLSGKRCGVAANFGGSRASPPPPPAVRADSPKLGASLALYDFQAASVPLC